MPQSREPGSPHSTPGGAESYKHEGTPDTRLTTFSPDENSARSSKLPKPSLNLGAAATGQYQILKFAVPPTDKIRDANKATASSIDKDPFVTVTTAAVAAAPKEPKLSPTASSFLPPANSALIVRGAVSNGLQGQGLPVNATKSSDVGQASDVGQKDQGQGSRFSNDLRLTRYLAIFSSNGPILPGHVDEYLARLARIGSPCCGSTEIVNGGNKVYLRLSNIRDAQNAHDNIRLGNPTWMAGYISALEYYQVANPGVVGHPISEGMILVMALLPSMPESPVNVADLESAVHNFLVGQGDVFAFQSLGLMDQPVWKAIVEFSDIDVAVTVASKFNGVFFDNRIQLVLTLIREDMGVLAASGPLNGYSATRTAVQDVSNMLQNLNVSAPPSQDHNATGLVPLGRPAQSQLGVPLYPSQYSVAYPTPVPAGPVRYVIDQAPTRSRGIPSMPGNIQMLGGMYSQPMMAYGPPSMRGEYGMARLPSVYGRPNDRRQNAMRISRGPYFNAAGHHNHVDVTRIRDGIDVRTTIMLRNIPNKVDQAMLKRIIDESSWGKYDFMYLRIDFANDCNVGYAFVNFVDPLDIIDFVNARANQRWNCFKSDKVAEVSYATIQGKDCLVQKFRNSSVMLEAPHYRPKLYFTSNGPRPELAGQEEPFPEPDNHSKMKRSCENAEHVGLFTPNSGQHFREEQRRRRSQYDRGTRLAALEEGDYDRYMPMRYLP